MPLPSSGQPLTRVEENKTIGSNQVDTATTCFAGQQEHKFLAFRIIELINKLLTFLDNRASFQSEVAISAELVSTVYAQAP